MIRPGFCFSIIVHVLLILKGVLRMADKIGGRRLRSRPQDDNV
jgi:hypothetical protein